MDQFKFFRRVVTGREPWRHGQPDVAAQPIDKELADESSRAIPCGVVIPGSSLGVEAENDGTEAYGSFKETGLLQTRSPCAKPIRDIRR
jgi:hypothetical protein